MEVDHQVHAQSLHAFGHGQHALGVTEAEHDQLVRVLLPIGRFGRVNEQAQAHGVGAKVLAGLDAVHRLAVFVLPGKSALFELAQPAKVNAVGEAAVHGYSSK